MVSTALCLALTFRPVDDVSFKRTYTEKGNSFYDVSMSLPGGAGTVKTTVQSTVQVVGSEGGTLHMKVLKIDFPGVPDKGALPDIVTKVGPSGMPNKASIKNGEEFFVFLGMAGLTTGTTAKIGEPVKVHWQNDLKDCTVDGIGKITKVDSATKLMMVDWKIDMKPSYTDSSMFAFKSVYDMSDMSLKSADGTMTIGGASIKMTVSRKEKGSF